MPLCFHSASIAQVDRGLQQKRPPLQMILEFRSTPSENSHQGWLFDSPHTLSFSPVYPITNLVIVRSKPSVLCIYPR